MSAGHQATRPQGHSGRGAGAIRELRSGRESGAGPTPGAVGSEWRRRGDAGWALRADSVRRVAAAGGTRPLVAWLAVALVVVAGCQQEPEPVAQVSAQAERGPIKFEVVAEPDQVLFGEPIRLSLRAVTPADHVVELPPLSAMKDVDVRAIAAPPPRENEAGELEWVEEYELSPWLAGEFEIPPLVMRYGRKPADPNGLSALDLELSSNTLRIDVQSTLETGDEMNTPRGVVGALAPPPPARPWLWPTVIGGGLLLVTLLGGAGWWLYRQVTKPPPPVPADVWALRALNALAAEGLVHVGRTREHYYGLSEIIRRYLEKQFGLAAPDMTTEEFLSYMAREAQRWPALSVDTLREFLQACDFVKYAAFEPDAETAEQALMTARDFVSRTAAAHAMAAEANAAPQREGRAA